MSHSPPSRYEKSMYTCISKLAQKECDYVTDRLDMTRAVDWDV